MNSVSLAGVRGMTRKVSPMVESIGLTFGIYGEEIRKSILNGPYPEDRRP